MKIRLSTKIFTIALAIFIILSVVFFVVNIKKSDKSLFNNYNETITTESIDNGKIINIQYTNDTIENNE